MYYSNQAKRQLSVDMAWEDDTKKLRTPVTSLEDLSNELIFEIFDYLDAREIFHQFSNLNQRFENLALLSNLPLKVCCSSLSERSFELVCLKMVIPNAHRILSLHLYDQSECTKFFTLCAINSSFYRLESLRLDGMTSEEIVSFLPGLTILPRLFSMKISINCTLNTLDTIYGLIFRLPYLKYVKLSADLLATVDSMLLITSKQCSSIEHLVIDHPCHLPLLYDILSYTPNLHRLICEHLFHYTNEKISLIIPFRSFNLTHVVFHNCHMKFDKLERFLRKVSSKLQVLHLALTLDPAYLDADRWERLICQHIPYLRTFQFQYSTEIYDHAVDLPFYGFIHRFTSSFWIEKGWMFNIQFDLIRRLHMKMISSILPYKKQWYDQLNDERKYTQSTEQESMDVTKSMSQLTVRGCYWNSCNRWFMNCTEFIDSLVTITSLHIEFSVYSNDVLVQFFHLLPNLDSLTIIFTDCIQNKLLTQEQIDTVSKINKITKVKIERLTDSDQIDDLLNFCPRIECLQVKCRSYADLQSILRLILLKRKSSLSSLCFKIAQADTSMVQNLQTIINFQKLLVNYTIQRIGDRIVLYWQRHG